MYGELDSQQIVEDRYSTPGPGGWTPTLQFMVCTKPPHVMRTLSVSRICRPYDHGTTTKCRTNSNFTVVHDE